MESEDQGMLTWQKFGIFKEEKSWNIVKEAERFRRGCSGAS